MPKTDFIDQLKKLGYEVKVEDGNKVSFPYTIPLGKFADKEIILGFIVDESFPIAAPTGPHISPKIHPHNPTNTVGHPLGGVHDSPFGSAWQYWSRPFSAWGGTDRSVRVYLSFVRSLWQNQ